MKYLVLIDTLAFQKSEKGTFLTTEQKIENAKKIKMYISPNIFYKVRKDLDEDMCIVEVWQECLLQKQIQESPV